MVCKVNKFARKRWVSVLTLFNYKMYAFLKAESTDTFVWIFSVMYEGASVNVEVGVT